MKEKITTLDDIFGLHPSIERRMGMGRLLMVTTTTMRMRMVEEERVRFASMRREGR